jgi:hypothetical protein
MKITRAQRDRNTEGNVTALADLPEPQPEDDGTEAEALAPVQVPRLAEQGKILRSQFLP